MKNIEIEKAIEKYNDMMFERGYEHNSIGTRLSENTENWNLRDMVSECQYVLDTCYEEGHVNSEGRYPEYWEITPDDVLNKSRYDRLVRRNNEERKLHKAWLSRTRRLRNFIKAYEPYIKNMKCTMGHCSSYDN